MNFSLTLEKTSNITAQSLSPEELLEQFVSLKRQYDAVLKQYEAGQQELHECRKNNQFANELKDHLAAEVEAWQRNEQKLKLEFNERLRASLDELEAVKREKTKQAEHYSNKIDLLQNNLAALQEANGERTFEEKSVTQVNSTKAIEDLKRYEEENEQLRGLVNEQKMAMLEGENTTETLKGRLAYFEEQIESLKCNLDSKKSELASTTELLHSVQEDLCVANGELQQLKTSANNHAVKGNSLFAEVDDKRQEMLKSYSQMKDKVHQLNRELLSKQAEIDSLICEKKTLWDEYAGQSSFHDAVLIKGYERRIIDLEKQNDHLQREIAQWYEDNLETNPTEITQWVSGVMEYYREENHRLSNEFAANSVDNLLKEQKLRDIQRQLVAWRTKAAEANATISELETKISTHSTWCKNVKNEPISPLEYKSKTPSRSDRSALEHSMKMSTIQDKENISLRGIENLPSEINNDVVAKPGILVTGPNKNKTVKKATFA